MIGYIFIQKTIIQLLDITRKNFKASKATEILQI